MDQVKEIREKTDLVALLQEYIPLKKMGRNFKTPCPFHIEKTPSFVVSPERQIWHCFGCQKGGDCFTFLMEYEHMEFIEALRFLAKKSGIVLEQSANQAHTSSIKEKLYALNGLVAEFYHYLLVTHATGQEALAYITEKRGINTKIISHFMVGYAPIQEQALWTYLTQKKHYSSQELFESGLFISQRGRSIDFFQKRLIFPLFDHRGNCIGFSGRTIDSTDTRAKYINTRETLVYHKAETLFGLNITKEAIKKEKKVIIMEGEFDVLSSFQEGIPYAVAVKGSALTQDQTRLLSRFTTNIALCFDSDRAGQEATKKSVPLLESYGFTTSIILTPDGKDPDESLHTNAVAFKQAIKHARPLYEFLINTTVDAYDITTGEGKQQIAQILLPLLIHIQNEVVKDHYMRSLSQRMDVSYESLTREMERIEKKEKRGMQQRVVTIPSPIHNNKEEYLVALVLQSTTPLAIAQDIRPAMRVYQFTVPALGKIVEKLLAWPGEQEFSLAHFTHTLPEELIPMVDTCYLLPLPKFTDDEGYSKEVNKIAYQLYYTYIKQEIKKIALELKSVQEEEKISTLQDRLTYLISLLPKD